jgi:nitrilase
MTKWMPKDVYAKFRAAAIQASPVFLDKDATIDKVGVLAGQAASKGAQLVVFGESFIPAFPIWNLVLRAVDQHSLFRELYDNSLVIPGPDVERLAEIARQSKIFLSVGITEKSPLSFGTLWNSNLLFDPKGDLINHRRKLVPTWAEKLTWANGDASGLVVSKCPIGRIGVLICDENTNPLARFAP